MRSIMKSIWRTLKAAFLGGIIIAVALVGFVLIFYLLDWFISLFRPKEVKWKEKQILSHRFYKVSGRGRIAYLILCLEETLRFYNQDLTAWEPILRKLWSITDQSTDRSENNWLEWIDIWLDSVGELLPSKVLTNDAAEISEIRNLYTQAGIAMIVINTILESAYTIVCNWDPDTDANDPEAIPIIDKTEETMEAFGIPLPANEIIQPILNKKDWSFGKPFDGLSLSNLSKIDPSDTTKQSSK